MKSVIFVSLLVAAIAIPLAEAQGLGLVPRVNITGTVFCSANASLPGPLPPPFPNATVELQCASSAGRIAVLATTTTNATGIFSIVLSDISTIISFLFSLIAGGCQVVVTTPLSACNVALAGTLASPLQFVAAVVQAIFNTLTFTVVGFVRVL